MVEKKLTIADLNLNKKCENGYEFEYLMPDGSKSGIFVTVLGAHAPKIQQWINKQFNMRRQQEAMQAKRNQGDAPRLVEEDIEFGVELMAIRITGWRGLDDAYSPATALTWCETDATLVEQVKMHSDNLANFTRSK